MKKPVVLVIVIGALALLTVLVVVIAHANRGLPAPRIVGPLSTNDVAEIIQAVLRERAPVSGQYAPRGAEGWGHRLRERVSGRIRSISWVNERRANVDFGDRWNPRIGYDYDVERTTNGWKVVGVGWREEPKKRQ